MKFSEQQPQADQVLMHHTPAWWIAEFRGPIGNQMREMAGCDTVMTGFNGHIPAAVVCQAIAMLNPSARVSVVESSAGTRAEPPAPASPPADAPLTSRSMLDIAADVVGTFAPAAPAPAPKAKAAPKIADVRPAIERAMKIKQRFGLLVACSYLREQGWSFEAAHRILHETLPREREADVPVL